MIIEQLDLIAFGRFTNRSIDLSAGPRRFHIVYGPNESGKSTSLRAINDWLFGFENRAVDDYVHKTSQLRVGGRLAEPETESVLTCIRRKGIRDTLLAADNKTKAESKLLESMLQGIDKTTFAQQFGISHQQLVDGGQLILKGEGDIGEILFSAGAGLSQLKQIRVRLEEDRKKLFSERGTTATLAKSFKELDELRLKLREIAILPMAYNALREKHARAVVEEKQNRQQLRDASAKHSRLDAMRRASELFVTRRMLQQKLEPVKDAILLDANFTNLRRDLNSKRIHAISQVNGLAVELEELQERLKAIQVDERWFQHESAIDSLNRKTGQYEQTTRAIAAKESRRSQILRQIEVLSRDLDGSQTRAGAPTISEQLEALSLSDAAQTAIRTLTNQHSGVAQHFSDASEQLHRASEVHRKLDDLLSNARRAASPTVLEEALRSIGNPQHLLAAESRARGQVESLREKANLLLHRLRGFNGTLEQAAALQVPSDSAFASAEQAIREKQQWVSSRRDQHQQAVADRATIRLKIDAHRNALSLPDSRDLDATKSVRDSLLEDLIDASTAGRAITPKHAIQLRDSVVDIDRIHTLLHDHHDQLLSQKQDEKRLQEVDARIEELSDAEKQAESNLQSAISQWRSLWSDIGVEPGDIQEMRDWRDDLVHLMKTAVELNDACIQLRQSTDAIHQAASQLRAAIAIGSPEPAMPSVTSQGCEPTELPLFDAFESGDDKGSITDDLLTLCASARSKLAELHEQASEYQSLLQQHKAATEKLDEAKSTSDLARKKVDAWQNRWISAVEPLQAIGAVTPESIDLMLRRVNEIAVLRGECVGIDSELQEMHESQRAFREAVLSVSKQCILELGGGDAVQDELSIASALASKLQQQLTNRLNQQTLADQVQKSCQAKKSLENEIERIKMEFLSLCKEAGCDSLDQLAERERASGERREITNEIRTVETQLQIYAGSDSIEQFETEASKYDNISLERELDGLNVEIEKREAELIEQQRNLGVLEADLNRMDGSERAATLLQDQQNLLAKIRREANEYATLTIAQEVLAKAVEHYRGQNEGSVVDRAKVYFCQMTCGQYSSLHVDFDDHDRPTLFAISQQDQSRVPANRLSDGTADALYLSMRIASLEVHLRNHKPIPLVIDDCLIQFDDARATATLKILSDLSLKTQVILFTHHAHLVQLATENLSSDEFHLHELDR